MSSSRVRTTSHRTSTGLIAGLAALAVIASLATPAAADPPDGAPAPVAAAATPQPLGDQPPAVQAPDTPTSPDAPPATSESWTPTSHTTNEDGSTTLEIYAQPHFKRTQQGWTAVDATITPGTGDAPFRAAGLVNPVHFGTTADALYTLDTLGGPITIGLPGATVTTPTQTDASTLSYPGIYPGVDLQLSTAGDRLGKKLILAGPDSPREFTFTIADPTHSLGTPTEGENESWTFSNPTAFSTGLELPLPAAWVQRDGANTGAPGTAHQKVTTTDAGYDITLTLDQEFAAAASWPVVLDPAVQWTTDYWTPGDGLQVAYGPTGATICDGHPCQLADPVDSWVGAGDLEWDDPDLGHYLTYVGADVTNLAGREVTESLLGWEYPGPGHGFFARELCSLIGAGSTGADLDSAQCGGILDSTLIDDHSWGTPFDPYWGFDITKQVRAAVKGRPVTGHLVGLAIDWRSTAPYWQYPGLGFQPPALRLTYTGYPVPRPLTPKQTFGCNCWAGTSTTNQASAADPVNTATGGLTENFTDLSVASTGVSIAWARTYNSLDTSTGSFGPGWSGVYGASLTQNAASEWVLRDGSGTQTRFGAVLGGGYAPLDAAVSSTLADGPNGSRVLRMLSGTTITFDSSGQMAAMKDALGQGVTLAYTSGQLTTITDALGQTATVTWDGPASASARVSQVTSSDGRTVSYGYTTTAGAKRLTSVTDVTGHTTTYAYDTTTGGLSKVTDPLGHESARNTFDATGRITSQRDETGAETTFTYNDTAHTTTVTDPTGRTRVDAYKDLNLVAQTDSAGNTTAQFYDSDNNRAATVDAADSLARSDYDDHDRLISRVAPAPFHYTETWAYDAADRVTSYTDPTGATTTYVYDTAGRLTSTTTVDGGVTAYTYTTGGSVPANLVATVTDPLGRVTTYGYDSAGNRTSVTTPGGHTTTFAYDDAHRLTSTTDPLGHTTSTTYDPAGRVLTTTDAVGKVTTRTYDAAGRLTRVTNPDTTWTEFTYDAAGRVTQTDTSTGHATSTTYDDAGRVLTSTDARGKTTAYAYDTAGRQISVTDPLGHATTTTYNDLGQVATVTDPTGATTTYAYDALGRVTDTTDADGVVTHTAYDKLSHVAATTNSSGGGTSSEYDPMGRLMISRDTDGTSTFYDHDLAGQLTSTRVPTAHPINDRWTSYNYDITSYTYDPDGNQLTTVDPLGHLPGAVPTQHTTTTTYDAAGRRTAVTDPLGHTTSYTYDAANRVTVTTDPAGNATTTAYDDMGRVHQVTSPTNKTTTYTYDDDSRLTAVTDPKNHTTTYAYDAVGNVTTKTDPLSRVTTYAYDDAGHLTTMVKPSGTATTAAGDGTTTYAYDNAGRPTTVTYSDGTPTLTYTYTAAGRLHTAARATDGISAADIQLTYDANGRVTGSTRTGPTTATATYGYTSAGRLAATSYPNGLGATYGYDQTGALTTYTPTGTTPIAPVTYAYDVAGRVSTISRGTNSPTVSSYDYDNAGQLNALTHTQGGNTLASYSITRDNRGNPTLVSSTTPPTTTVIAADGFTRARTGGWGNADAGGAWTVSTNTYTSVGSGTAKQVIRPGTTVTSTLRSVASTDTDLRATFTIDKEATGGGQYLHFQVRKIDANNAYDAQLRVMTTGPQLRLDAVSTMLAYVNLTNLPAVVNTPLSIRVQATGTNPTTLRAKVWPAGTDEPTAWQLTTTDSTAALQGPGSVGLDNYLSASATNGNVTFTLDDLDVQTTATNGNRTSAYAYDANGWLTDQCTYPTGQACASVTADHTAYTYDAVGNRATQTDTAPAGTGASVSTTTAYTYDAADQLTTAKIGTTTVLSNTWTPDGTIATTTTPAGTRTQTTNLAGEVTGYTLADGRTVAYSYDPDGNRTARTVNGTLNAQWTWDTIGGLATRTAQYNGAGALSTAWLPDPTSPGGALAAAAPGGTSTWLLADPFANVTLAQPTGAGTSTLALGDAFGDTVAPVAPATVNGLGFAGQYLDQITGLYDVRARDYDPTTGRFTTTDPITLPIGTPAFGGFSYSANSPLRFIDPSGLSFWDDLPANLTALMNTVLFFGNPFTDHFDNEDRAVPIKAAESYGAGALNGSIKMMGGPYSASHPWFYVENPNACDSTYDAPYSLGEWAGPQNLLLATGAEGAEVGALENSLASRVELAGSRLSASVDRTVGAALPSSPGISAGASVGVGAGAVRMVAHPGGVVELFGTSAEGSIQIIANMSRSGRAITLSGLHAEGSGANSVGTGALRGMLRQWGLQQGADTITIQGGARTTGSKIGQVHEFTFSVH